MTDNRPAGLRACLLTLLIVAPAAAAAVTPAAAPAAAPAVTPAVAPAVTPAVTAASANPPGPVLRSQEVHAATRDREDRAEDAGKATHGTEPSTWLLLGTGLAVILLFHHQRQRQRHHHRPPPLAEQASPVAPPASR